VFDRLLRLLIPATAVAALGFGLWTLSLEFRVIGTLGLGARVAAGRVVEATAAARALQRPEPSPEGPTCRSDVGLAAGFVGAGLVDATIRSGALESVATALARLERAARAILVCNPGSGIAWVWLAYARDQSGATTDEVHAHLRRALAAAPSDYWVLAARLTQAARIGSRRSPATFEDVVRADVRTLLEGTVDESRVAEVLGPIFPWIQPVGWSEFGRLTDGGRRFALIQAMGRLGINVAACDPRRFNDWLYRGLHGSCEDPDRIPNLDWRRPRS
jgi:hypothetical protein